MASAFGHVFSAIAIGSGFDKTLLNWKFRMLGIICSVLPDADVITFSFGIPYEDFWGHRGFSHSFVFAFMIAVLFTYFFYPRHLTLRNGYLLLIYFFLCTASHNILDAMTNGGLGVAFFAPFDNTRYFFPWRPIRVSPIGIDTFFGERGWQVILSELIWIGIPGTVLVLMFNWMKKMSITSNSK